MAFLRWDRRVAVDHASENAAQRLDTKRQWRHVQQQYVLDIALQNARLNGRAHGNNFIGVHASMRFFAKEAFHHFAHLWHAGHAANQNDLVNLAGLDTRIRNGFLARLQRPLNQIVDQLFKVGTGDILHQMLRPILIGGNERQVDFGGLCRRQLNLRLF